MERYDVAVVGATGAVGETMIAILEERDFPVGELYPLASERSAGKTVRFRGKSIAVTDLAQFDFSRAGLALFSAGGGVSAEHAPRAAAAYAGGLPGSVPHSGADHALPTVRPRGHLRARAHHARGW